MSRATADILLHPIRLRIVLAFGSEQLTTAELATRLPDIPHATLYRQVATLADGGLLEIVTERRVRGGVERTYALVTDAASLRAADVASLSHDELLEGFVVFAGSMIEAFGRYLDHPSADPATDPVSYRQAALWLDDDERRQLIERLREAVGPYLANEPRRGRQRLLLDTVLIPDPGAAAAADVERGD